jgi:hypothetical protein
VLGVAAAEVMPVQPGVLKQHLLKIARENLIDSEQVLRVRSCARTSAAGLPTANGQTGEGG